MKDPRLLIQHLMKFLVEDKYVYNYKLISDFDN